MIANPIPIEGWALGIPITIGTTTVKHNFAVTHTGPALGVVLGNGFVKQVGGICTVGNEQVLQYRAIEGGKTVNKALRLEKGVSQPQLAAMSKGEVAHVAGTSKRTCDKQIVCESTHRLIEQG